MTIAKKISALRKRAGISQEQLAEKLSISRQSVSKWESGQVLPKLDMILSICDLFGISADDFLREDAKIPGTVEEPYRAGTVEVKTKYFGTDGFRGEVNSVLTSEHAFKIGRFLGWYFATPMSGCRKPNYRPRIVIGKDTRRSSYTLEYAIAAGLTASGADAYMLHVTTTPSVSYVTRVDGFDCGIMITASHNPFYDNGIKVINSRGEKLDDYTASLIEAYMDGNLSAIGVSGDDIPLARRENIGCIVDYVAGRNRYVGYLISLAAHSYRDMRIGLDCANGASWMIAKSVFEALGAQTYVIGNTPNGTNVNEGTGSTHIENLCRYVRENRLDVGFSFDGDADRCIAVDEKGQPVDGDKILFVLARRLSERGMLNNDTVVTTIMSNSGLDRALDSIGVKNVRTDVGDRFVFEKMESDGLRLGGEQSGHIIIRKYATTGDGILTAIMLTEEMRDRKSSLSALCAPVELYPQMTKSVRVTDRRAAAEDPAVQAAVAEADRKLKGDGRILLRVSGTEPVVRIMAECRCGEQCASLIESVYEVIQKRGYCCD